MPKEKLLALQLISTGSFCECVFIYVFCNVSMLVVSRPDQLYFKTAADMKKKIKKIKDINWLEGKKKNVRKIR